MRALALRASALDGNGAEANAPTYESNGDRRVRRTLNALQALPFWSYAQRAFILRRMGVELGPKTLVDQGCHFGPGKVSIGDETYVGIGCFFDAEGGVSIGARCAIGHRTNFVTSVHAMGQRNQRAIGLTYAPVTVEDGCWLATEVLILPGVTIARGCAIGARAVVTKSTEPDGLYLGSPARRVRDL